MYFAENGSKVSVLTKVFDNTKNISNVYTVIGVQNNENVTMTAKYKDVNVGEGKELVVTISDTNNYQADPDLVGKITKYIVVVRIKSGAYTYRIAADDPNREVILIKGIHYDISNESVEYLTSKLGASVDFEICTTKNQVGLYSLANNTLKVNKFTSNPQDMIGNLGYTIEGSFEIKNPDGNALIVNLEVKCEDGGGVNIADISKLVLVSPDASVDKTLVVAKPNANNIVLTDVKSYFANKQIIFDLEFLSSYASLYWIDGVKVNNVSQSIANGNRITYKITDTSVVNINIVVYITTLNIVQFNYNLASGEVLADMVTSTKFAKGQTIQDSITKYGAVLPNVTRQGWVFDGWQAGSIKLTKDTEWWSGNTTVVANYYLDEIGVSQSFDEETNDPISAKFSTDYDAVEHKITYSVTNANPQSITYTYKWTNLTTNTVLTNTTNTLVVKNVNQNGNYKIDITAKSGSQTKTYTHTVQVEIKKINFNIALPCYDNNGVSSERACKKLGAVKADFIICNKHRFVGNAKMEESQQGNGLHGLFL